MGREPEKGDRFQPSCSSKMRAARWFHIFTKTIKAEMHCKEAARAENTSHSLVALGEPGSAGPDDLVEAIMVPDSVGRKPHKKPLNLATPSKQPLWPSA